METNRIQQVEQTISRSNKSMKRHMHQWYIVFYHVMMLLSVIGFLWLVVTVFRAQPPQPIEQNCCLKCPASPKPMSMETVFCWTMVMKTFVIVVSSLLFIWWMTFLRGLIEKSKDSMKEWNCKVRDAYGKLFEIEIEHYKNDKKTEPAEEQYQLQRVLEEKEKAVAKLRLQYEKGEKLKDLLEEEQQLKEEIGLLREESEVLKDLIDSIE